MHISAIVLGFAATVAGIDLRLYDSTSCTGSFYHWENVRPDICYSYADDMHGSAEWRAVPLDWTIIGHVFRASTTGSPCNNPPLDEEFHNKDAGCMIGKSFSMLCHLPGRDPHAVILHLLSLNDANPHQRLADKSHPPVTRSKR